jgi:hypothetical protein
MTRSLRLSLVLAIVLTAPGPAAVAALAEGRVAEPSLGLITGFPWSAPYEELRLKGR